MANLFCVKDKVVIITGGAGILGRGRRIPVSIWR